MTGIALMIIIITIILLIAAFKANNELGKRIGYRAAALIFQPILVILLAVGAFGIFALIMSTT